MSTYVLGCELYVAEWLLWPPAQFVNFYFLPTRYRVAYDNLISLIYDVYTSHVKHKPRTKNDLC
jgi:protein Mpv17